MGQVREEVAAHAVELSNVAVHARDGGCRPRGEGGITIAVRAIAQPRVALTPASTWRGRALLLRAALLVGVLAVYVPHIPGDFVWDDREYILREPRMYAPDGARALLTQPFGPPGGGVYRPVSTLSFWAQAHAQGMSMTAFRALNVVIHASVAQVLVSVLAALGASLEACFVGALLFGLHPGATESTMFINARHDSLGTLFALGALAASLRPTRTPRALVLTALAAGLGTLVAMSCKEVFALTPAFLALAALLPALSPEDLAARARRAATFAGVAGVFVVAALLWRRHLAISTGNALTGASLAELLRFVMGAVAHYVSLAVTGRQGFTALAWRAPSTTAAALWALGLVGAAAGLLALRKRSPATAARAALGLAWLVLFAATAALAAPATGQYANRYLYGPLAGWSMLVGVLVALALDAGPRVRSVTLGAALTLAVVFALTSAAQAARWKTALDLFGADLPEGDRDARVLYHYGVAVARAHGCPAALGLFVRAAELEPGYSRAWHNVTGCLLQMGLPREAVEPARRALRLDPRDPRNVINLGTAYALSGDRPRGENLLRIGCAAAPTEPSCARLRPP